MLRFVTKRSDPIGQTQFNLEKQKGQIHRVKWHGLCVTAFNPIVLMRKNTTAAAGRVLHGGTQGNRRDCERSACSGFMSANADTCLCRGDVVRQGGMDVTRAESPLRASQTPLTTLKWPTLPITHCSSHCGRETITQMVAYEHSSLCNNALGQLKSRLKCNLLLSAEWGFMRLCVDIQKKQFETETLGLKAHLQGHRGNNAITNGSAECHRNALATWFTSKSLITSSYRRHRHVWWPAARWWHRHPGSAQGHPASADGRTNATQRWLYMLPHRRVKSRRSFETRWPTGSAPPLWHTAKVLLGSRFVASMTDFSSRCVKAVVSVPLVTSRTRETLCGCAGTSSPALSGSHCGARNTWKHRQRELI